jgi:large repetitive protein
MKTKIFFKQVVCLLLFILSFNSFSQNLVPFTTRFDDKLKGDILLIGNNILNRQSTTESANTPYNTSLVPAGNVNNSTLNMQYINVDPTGGNFSSSSANLVVPAASRNCYVIKHAGLYWGAVLRGNNPDFNKVKFKYPGSANYQNIEGDVIIRDNNVRGEGLYVCYSDVTNLLNPTNAEGTYTLANVLARTGRSADVGAGPGNCAGWTLFIVYEDPKLSSKSITSFDGFSSIGGTTTRDILIDGFKTIPVGPVRAKLAFSALEGDRSLIGDQMKINPTANPADNIVSTPERFADNFFNGTVNDLSGVLPGRNPDSNNTISYDAGIIEVLNTPNNKIIKNNDTRATIQLSSTGDFYNLFFTAFSVEIIEPKIRILKTVEDADGKDVANQPVILGQQLTYQLKFKNIGNDNAAFTEIRDILPLNTSLIGTTPPPPGLPSGINISGVTGLTPAMVTVDGREIIFRIPNDRVIKNGPDNIIRITVKIAETCNELSTACSNIVQNQAFASYRGVDNPEPVTDDPSLSGVNACGFGEPSPTNFLADLEKCKFEKDITLCGDSVTLTAANGYTSYSWSTSPTGTPVVGTGQNLVVTTAPGTYYVNNIAPLDPPNCKSIQEKFNVTRFGVDFKNPIIPLADEVVVCPNTGEDLPNIYLCGSGDVAPLNLTLATNVTAQWFVLNCPNPADYDIRCPNSNLAANCWTPVQTGPNYNADTAGQYKLVQIYPGGCPITFYFNVYENTLTLTETNKDIYCNKPGSITVGGVPVTNPNKYEYQLYRVDNVTLPYGVVVVPWQESNVFDNIATPGLYNVLVRQIGVPSGCEFPLPNIQIEKKELEAEVVVTSPLCDENKGSIQINTAGGRANYTYTIYTGNPAGPFLTTSLVTTQDTWLFTGLNSGIYTYEVKTDDGCLVQGRFEIADPTKVVLTAILTKPLTDCTPGEITLTATGGVSPYNFFVNGNAQGNPVFEVNAPGTYNVSVFDFNNCEAKATVEVVKFLPPVFTIDKKDILCSGSPTGSITINVTNANGNILEYSIDGGITYLPSNIFANLPAGNYSVIVKYTVKYTVLGTEQETSCFSTPQIIIIENRNPLTGTATLTQPYTCLTTGTITVSGVTGGTAPYEYSIGGVGGVFQTSNVFPNLTNGTYSVTIKDANGCTFTITPPIVIDPLNPPTDLSFTATPLSCPANTSSVTLVATGGTPNLQYQIIAPATAVTAYQNSSVFNNLAPGSYTFQVKDAKDCIYQEDFLISPLPPISVTGQLINNVICFGTASGAIQFNVTGATNYSYTINNGAPILNQTNPTITLNTLVAGNYVIVVTNTATNCTATANVQVLGPPSPIDIQLQVTQIPCFAPSEGQVIVTATGGWGGYTYSLTQPNGSVIVYQNSNIFTGLTQIGLYTVNVKDANGCIEPETFTLNPPVGPTAIIDPSSDLCYDTVNQASIVVTTTGGTAPYQYSISPATTVFINGTTATGTTFANLLPGTYNIIVRDNLGCTFPLTAIVKELGVSAVLTKGLDCTATPNGIITGTITGGTAPYTYQVSINGGAYATAGTTGTTTFTYPVTGPGNYQFQVLDSSTPAPACAATSGVIQVTAPVNPTATTQVIDATCSGLANGTVTIIPSGGIPNYAVNFNNLGFSTNLVYTNLLPGTYPYIVRDALGCIFTDSVTVGGLPAITFTENVTQINCLTSNFYGSIELTSVTNGVGPFTYNLKKDPNTLEQSFTTPTATAVPYLFGTLPPGDYILTVTDSRGCFADKKLIITPPIEDIDIKITDASDCSGASITIDIISTSLVGPFTVGINDLNTIPFTQNPITLPLGVTTYTFTGLNPDIIYSFVVSTNGTCYYFEKALSAPLAFTKTKSKIDKTTDVTCKGSGDGTVTFTVSDYDATLITYTIFTAFGNVSTGITGTITGASPQTVGPIGGLVPGSYYIRFVETGGSYNGCVSVSPVFRIDEPVTPLSADLKVTKNDNCNLNAGVLVANGQGGTAPYLYIILPSVNPAPLANDPRWTTNNFINTESGDYIAYVKDANNCIRASAPVRLDADPIPAITTRIVNQCDGIEGGFIVEINFTATGTSIPPYSYSLNGPLGPFIPIPAGATFPFLVTNLNSGPYSIILKDNNGCEATSSGTILKPLGISALPTVLPSCANNDGQITATATGGSGNYTYTLLNALGTIIAGPQPINIFSGLGFGTYTVRVTDTTSNTPNCTKDASVTLEEPTQVTFNLGKKDVACFGGSDGSITVTLPSSNNNPQYQYELIAPSQQTRPLQFGNTFTGLPAGIYTVRVVSGRDCKETDTIEIFQPGALNASWTANPFTCAANNAVNTTNLEITTTGGTAPYTYAININSVVYTAINQSGVSPYIYTISDIGVNQTINITVTDANGCPFVIPVNTVDTLVPINGTIAQTPITCRNPGLLTITATGGSGNYNFFSIPTTAANITQNGAPTGNTFNVTAPGDYYFQIYDTTTKCYKEIGPFTVAPFNTIKAVALSTTPVSCFGLTDGTITVDVSGYTGAYTWTVYSGGVATTITGTGNTATNPFVITGLAAGSYAVQILAADPPFCDAVTGVIPVETPEELKLDVKEGANVTCDNNKGVIVTEYSGGTGPFTINVVRTAPNPANLGTQTTGLSAGTYTVTVTDAKNCTATDNIELILPTPITAAFAAVPNPLLCNGDANAVIDITPTGAATGGQGTNYTYVLNTILPVPLISAPQVSTTFPGLPVGTYTVTVQDGLNCKFTTPEIVITQPTVLRADLVLVGGVQTCTVGAPLTLTASGGTPPYSYSTTATGTFIPMPTNPFTIPNNPPGTYSFFVKDANNCPVTKTNDITVPTIEPLTIKIVSSDVVINCFGENDGAVTVIASGGLGNYSYTISLSPTGLPAITTNTTGVFNNLVAGIYYFSVISSDCPITPLRVEIKEATTEALNVPDPVIVAEICAGERNGSITFCPTGGTPPYLYAIDPIDLSAFVTDNDNVPCFTFDKLAPGTYDVVVQDQLGCFQFFNDIVVGGAIPINFQVSDVLDEICADEDEGSFIISGITGGTAPYSVGYTVIYPDGSTFTSPIVDLGAGVTTYTFDKLNGGVYTVIVYDSAQTDPALVRCSTSREQIIGSGADFKPIAEVTYPCIDNKPSVLVIVRNINNPDNGFDPDGGFVPLSDYSFTLTSGTQVFRPQFSNVFTSADYPTLNDPTLAHFITVTNVNSCTKVTEPPFVTMPLEPLTIKIIEGNLNQIVAIVTGGSGGYTYTFNGISTGTDNTYFYEVSGTYTVVVTDSSGCTATASKYFEFTPICIPNFFTPDGDGNNDGWTPGCTENYPNLRTLVYDRYGRKLAELKQAEFWDGTYNGEPLPSGDYWYVVKVDPNKDKQELVGHFTLYR